MTNEEQELIKKAVELAPGWWWKEGCIHMIDQPMHFYADAAPQSVLDALAAELVRQVDRLDDDTAIYVEPGETKVGQILNTGRVMVNVTYGTSPDRTMNTIRAIVESGVLTNGNRSKAR